MASARIYIRRSDDEQSGFSPAAQEREARRWCTDNGREVVAVYTDDDLRSYPESGIEIWYSSSFI